LRTVPGERQPAEVVLEGVFGTRPAAAWVAELRAVDVPVELARDVDRLAFVRGFVDDQVNLERGRVVSYEWGERGRVDQQRFPPQFGREPALAARPGIAGLGEDTAEVLAEVGLTGDELAAAIESGTVPGEPG
jgi:crotonobetainyl-CoA:carnitine CoA-transferase CaiB-like acyl-CoA transferase